MSVSIYIQRFIIANALTVYYGTLMIISFVLNYIKNPFANPRAHKLRLEPPPRLSDPKYGVHKYLKANDIKLHYVESGDPSKPLMLFLHGFPEFWYSWRHQIVHFKNDYWCIAVDLRGYGDSERPEGLNSYNIDLLTEDVRDFIRQLGREKCILVSHDWGGLIACRFRDVYPDALSAIVMLASTSREAWVHEIWNNPVQRKHSWYVFMFRAPMIAERWLQENNLELFNKIMLVPGKTTADDEDVECYKYWFRKQNAMTPPVNYYRANFAYTLPEKPRCDRNIPFLVAHAAKDAFLNHSLLDIMKKEYEYIETTIVDNCGHFMQQEEPGKVNSLIRDFLIKHKL